MIGGDVTSHGRLIADILLVSDRFAGQNPQTLVKFAEGWLEGVEFIKAQPARAHTLIGTIKDFNIPDDLAKTMQYWLGRAQEAAGDADAARATYGVILQMDYNYSDVRARLDALTNRK